MSHRVVIHTRALRMTLQAEFDSAALSRHWASRLQHARSSGSAITIGNVRLTGSEITRIEHGPIGGELTVLAAVDPVTGVPAGDGSRALA